MQSNDIKIIGDNVPSFYEEVNKENEKMLAARCAIRYVLKCPYCSGSHPWSDCDHPARGAEC